MIAERPPAGEMLDRRGQAPFELIIIIAVEQVVLAIVLVLDQGVGLGQALREEAAFGIALHAAAIGMAAPVEIDVRQVGAVVPDLLVDHRLEARAIGSGLRAEDAAAGAPLSRSEEHTSELQSLIRNSYA